MSLEGDDDLVGAHGENEEDREGDDLADLLARQTVSCDLKSEEHEQSKQTR